MRISHRLRNREKIYRATVDIIQLGKNKSKMESVVIAGSIEAAGKLMRAYLKEELPSIPPSSLSIAIYVDVALTN